MKNNLNDGLSETEPIIDVRMSLIEIALAAENNTGAENILKSATKAAKKGKYSIEVEISEYDYNALKEYISQLQSINVENIFANDYTQIKLSPLLAKLNEYGFSCTNPNYKYKGFFYPKIKYYMKVHWI